MNDRSKQYFNSHIGVFFNKFIKSIKASEKWVIKYDFKDSSKTKPLDDQHIASLLGQMKREGYLNEIREEYANIDEAEYDFFTTDINELKQITITKIEDTRTNKNKNDIVYQNLINNGASQEVLDNYIATKKTANKNKRLYRTRQGKFWKYTLALPINLTRYGIYNKITKDTVDEMTKDNCLIYACIQAGVDEDTINHMREIIRVRSFPASKLTKIANECNLSFKVNEVDYDEN